MPTCATAEAEAPSPEAVSWPEAEALLCFSFRGSVVAWGWDGGEEGLPGCSQTGSCRHDGARRQATAGARLGGRRPAAACPSSGSRQDMTVVSLRTAARRGGGAGGGGGGRQAAGLAAGACPRLLMAGSGRPGQSGAPACPRRLTSTGDGQQRDQQEHRVARHDAERPMAGG